MTFQKNKPNNGSTLNGNGKKNQSIEGTKNWENSMTGDGDRFSQQPEISNGSNGKKDIKRFDIYLKRKDARAEERKAANLKPLNSKETSSIYTNFHGQTRS